MQSRRVISMSAQYWPESTLLSKIVGRVALLHRLGREDSADLLQEVRVAVLRQSPTAILTAFWIFTVARRKAIDILRARIHEREIPSQGSRGPEANQEELIHLVRARVSLLPEKLFQFYELRYRRGMSERELAQFLGICRASVRYLDRLLRRCLGNASGPAIVTSARPGRHSQVIRTSRETGSDINTENVRQDFPHAS